MALEDARDPSSRVAQEDSWTYDADDSSTSETARNQEEIGGRNKEPHYECLQSFHNYSTYVMDRSQGESTQATRASSVRFRQSQFVYPLLGVVLKRRVGRIRVWYRVGFKAGMAHLRDSGAGIGAYQSATITVISGTICRISEPPA